MCSQNCTELVPEARYAMIVFGAGVKGKKNVRQIDPPKPDLSGEARAAAIRTVKYLGTPMLALLIVITNGWYPVIRFSDERANVAVGAAIWLMLWAAAIFALFIPGRWLTTIIVVVLMVPLMLMIALVLLLQGPSIADTFSTRFNPEFKPIAHVPMGGYSVGICQLACGTLCDDDINVLQEKEIFPGILLVRELPGFDLALWPTYQMTGRDTLRVDVPRYGEGRGAVPARSRVYCMRPWLYFGHRPTPSDHTDEQTHPIVLVLEGHSLIMPSREIVRTACNKRSAKIKQFPLATANAPQS
jgi:hypothetical protein